MIMLTSISSVTASVGMRPQAPKVTFPCCRATAPETARSSAVQQHRLWLALQCAHTHMQTALHDKWLPIAVAGERLACTRKSPRCVRHLGER